ncbi:MAG: site-specific DNA-methyltransferase [Bacillota bacterium]|nr:site-specific DNA-methyltransferase [Bacillota bacterium]
MMSLTGLVKAYEEGKKQYGERISETGCGSFAVTEAYEEGYRSGEDERDPAQLEMIIEEGSGGGPGENAGAKSVGRMALGDNLEYMEFLLKEKDMAGKIQFIYVDPPFFSGSKYQASIQLESEHLGTSKVIKTEAYDDSWSRGMEGYLAMLTVRLLMMRELLSEQGCICVHLDRHVTHYAKVLLDQIFGEKNFINEIIWTYKSGGASKRSFARKHDNLLLYGKTSGYKFNVLREKSYNRELKPYRFQGVEEFQDETGWYTMVNMKDVWQLDMVGRTSKERTGYATQKPEKLIERLVKACSDVGDLCADFFAGSGTLGAVCAGMNRDWIMCDEGRLSLASQIGRLTALKAAFSVEEQPDVHGKCGASECMAHEIASEMGVPEFLVERDTLQLCGYRHRGDLSGVADREQGEILRYQEEDGLSLVKCWSVDFHYDGKVHRPQAVMSRGAGRIAFDHKKVSDVWSVSGYDVLGGRFCCRIDRKQAEAGKKIGLTETTKELFNKTNETTGGGDER